MVMEMCGVNCLLEGNEIHVLIYYSHLRYPTLPLGCMADLSEESSLVASLCCALSPHLTEQQRGAQMVSYTPSRQTPPLLECTIATVRHGLGFKIWILIKGKSINNRNRNGGDVSNLVYCVISYGRWNRGRVHSCRSSVPASKSKP